MAKTKVTGVKVTRKNNKFTVSWSWSFAKSGDSVTKQWLLIHPLWYTSNNKQSGSQKTIRVDKGKKQVTVDDSDYGYLDLEQYFDGTDKRLKCIEFVVYGETKKTSDKQEEGKKVFDFHKPKKPSLVKTKIADFTRRWTWKGTTANDSKNPAWGVEWQTWLEGNPSVSKIADMNKLMDRKSPSTPRNKDLTDYKTIQEDSAVSGGGSFLRIFRVRTYGAGGVSDWNTSYELYAYPSTPKDLDAMVTPKNNQEFCVNTYFNNPNSSAHQIKKVYVEYVIDTPLTGMLPPSSGWTTGHEIDDYKKKDKRVKVDFDGDGVPESEFEEAVSWKVNNATIGLDKCLFVRVRNVYGDFETTSSGIIARNGYGRLTAPALTNVVPDDTNKAVQVSVNNQSAVPDSHVVLFITRPNDVEVIPLGVISGTGTHTSTFQYPDGVEECGSVIAMAHVGEVDEDGYIQTTLMESDKTYESGVVPKAPSVVTLSPTDRVGVMRVDWDWAWEEADQAEISWSDYEYAWESTDQPENFEMSKVHSSTLYITDLETGIPIYVRVRYISGYDDTAVYGPYSETQSLVLQSAPNVPSLRLSKYVIAKTDETKATWVYTSNDNSTQQSAEIAEYDADNDEYTVIVDGIGEEQFAYITPPESWSTGTTHDIRVRVWSSKGQPSEWSESVFLAIADPLTCTISSTNLVEEEIDIGGGDTRECLSLKAMPLTVTVTGAGETNTTSVLIRRAEAFHIERPDDESFDGYKGETIALRERTGEDTIVIDDSDLMFDDEAQYEIVATVSDNYGQSAQAVLPFEVHWTHQAIMPSATVTIENGAARIVPRANATQGDTVDIYRLSADKPQRILTGGNFNTVYVDPYPTIGEHGGYRIVYRTVNGDYKTADGRLAWVDVSTNYMNDKAIINFGGEHVELYYNVDESNSWQKDFVQTKYLGGAIQGDWNVGVTQSGSLSAVAIKLTDQAMIDTMRRLANYTGPCHVRTIGGASYTADVQVSESIGHDKGKLIYNYSLTINKVDPIGDEAMLYSEWVS